MASSFEEWYQVFDYEGTALSDRAFAQAAFDAGRASVLGEVQAIVDEHNTGIASALLAKLAALL